MERTGINMILNRQQNYKHFGRATVNTVHAVDAQQVGLSEKLAIDPSRWLFHVAMEAMAQSLMMILDNLDRHGIFPQLR